MKAPGDRSKSIFPWLLVMIREALRAWFASKL
jgi:hypothetical protein